MDVDAVKDQPEQQDAQTAEYKHIRLLFTNCAGIRLTKIYPRRAWPKLQQHGTGSAAVNIALTAVNGYPASNTGITSTGEMRLKPYPHSLQPCPWHPGHAIACADQTLPSGQDWNLCPRTALKRQLERLETSQSMTLKVGFELEFYLLRPRRDENGVTQQEPLGHSHLYSQSSALLGAVTVLDEMVAALEAMRIPVETYHAEAGDGQFEIATQYTDALQAADNLQYTWEAVAAVADKHGLVASFLPLPFAGQSGSGCHCHLSLWQDGRSVMHKFRLDEEARQGPPRAVEAFVGGLWQHLQSLLLYTLPSPASAMRAQPGSFCGVYRIWGLQNREAPIRLIEDDASEAVSNVELKCLDSTMNPYIALTAITQAGMLGMQSSARLPPKCQSDPVSEAFQESEEAQSRPDITLLQTDLRALVMAASRSSSSSEELRQLASSSSGHLPYFRGCPVPKWQAVPLLPPELNRVYVAVKHTEARLWMERMKELERYEGDELSEVVPEHALDKEGEHVCYPPELLLRY